MFLFLTLLFFAVIQIEMARSAIDTGRAWVMADIHVQRAGNPFGYWLLTCSLILLAIGTSAGIPYFVYSAATHSGPYAEAPFFSLDRAWPFAASSIAFGWLAYKFTKRRLLRKRAAAQLINQADR